MDTRLGTAARPARIAIIGAGPAGFYAAEALLKQKDLVCTIDLFNRFPTPFGLVRDGVAPDHQSIKAVTRIYDKILENSSVRYFGNVTFGSDVTHADLKPLYDQLVYAVGAQTDRRMNIPGEDLDGSFPATAFVGWYNGHPDYRDLEFDLSVERAVVVGNGNVAMDVARILVTDPDELATTDIADHALEQLRASMVREVVVLGRRGPAQAAFTNAEIKEFGELAGVDAIVDEADLVLDAESEASLAGNKIAARNVDILRGFAQRQSTGGPRRLVLQFLRSPVELLGENGRVTAVCVERNTLTPDGKGGLRATGTGQFETVPAGLVLRSVGYRGVALPGVPFDEQACVIPNAAGRVTQSAGGETVAGEYVVGWIKRGPSGVIGTNKADAVATVQSMIADVATLPGIADDRRDPQIIAGILQERVPNLVMLDGWRTLDTHETSRGAEQGRPRVKVTRVLDMLDVIGRRGLS